MLDSLIEVAFLLTAALVVCGAWLLFAHSPAAASWVLVAAFIATEGIQPGLTLVTTVGGYSVHGLDVVAFVMLGVGVVRLVSRNRPAWMSPGLVLIAVLFVAHLLWGAMEFGPQTAVNWLRPWLYFISPLVYAAYAVPQWTRASFRPLLAGAAFLSIYAFVRIADVGLHGANVRTEIGGQLFYDTRPVTGVAALFMLQCVIVAVSARFITSQFWLVAVLTISAAIVFVQFRTVWAIALITLAIAYVKWARGAIFANERVALGVAAVVLMLVPVAVASAASSSSLEHSVESTTAQDSTLRWRTESWRRLIEAHSSPAEIALGVPAGTPLAREVNGQIRTESPHSVYVDSWLSFGILGPVLVLWLGVGLYRRRRRVADAYGLSSLVVGLLMVGQAIFAITTMFGPVQGLLTGMLLQASALDRSSESDPPDGDVASASGGVS